MRQKKREFMNNSLRIPEEKYKNKGVRNFYQEVHRARTTYKPKSMICNHKEGNIISNEAECLK